MKTLTFPAVAACLLVSVSFGQPVYFLVADDARTESYVLGLTDPLDIDHARELIRDGAAAGQPIVVAQVACGGDGINRDLLSPTKRAWNWHVSAFESFEELTIEILDGRPSDLLTDCDWWMSNAGGRIGFWSFTVVEELGTDPEPWRCNFAYDNTIDLSDMAVLGQYWMRNDCLSPDWCGGTDLDHNHSVDLTDLSTCLGAWLSAYAKLPVWFEAWNCPTQCHGDANCALESGSPFGPKYPVGMADASILTSIGSLPVYCGDMLYDPRADFDRDCDVDQADVDILEHWLRVEESEFPTDCPVTR